MAQRDLEATLQLLAERAQYITGATGAAIARCAAVKRLSVAQARGLWRPRSGHTSRWNLAFPVKAFVQKQILRCNDAQTDTRVNRESCEALGISSVVVMPLLRDNEVNGVFELLSDRPNAFEERDIGALERLGEMVQTALDHDLSSARGRRAGEILGTRQRDRKARGDSLLRIALIRHCRSSRLSAR